MHAEYKINFLPKLVAMKPSISVNVLRLNISASMRFRFSNGFIPLHLLLKTKTHITTSQILENLAMKV